MGESGRVSADCRAYLVSCSPVFFLRRWVRWCVLVCLVWCMVFLSACSPRVKMISFQEVSLRGVVAVISLNPQYEEEVRKSGGMVVFIRKDGSYQTVKTAGMAYQKPLWTRRGVFFADYRTNYFISSSSPYQHREVASPKTLFQNTIIEDPRGEAVGIFDVGFTADIKNTLQLIPLSSKNLHTITSGIMSSSAFCGTHLWGLREGPVDEEKGLSYFMLRQIAPFSSKKFLIDSASKKLSAGGIWTTYCDRGEYVSVASYNPREDISQPQILRWNIHTGKPTLIPIRDKKNHPLTVPYDQSQSYDRGSFSPDGSTLVFVSYETGDLIQVNTHTGRILHRFNPQPLPRTISDNDLLQHHNDFSSTRHYYSILRIQYGSGGKFRPAQLFFINKTTRKTEMTITLNQTLTKLMKGYTKPYVYDGGFTANPNL